jgi:tRNA U34 5-carboxymethylaminomethyl modifying GTPase MnmE/TrmE
LILPVLGREDFYFNSLGIKSIFEQVMNKLTGWDDTIVALATPPGIGAIGIIRLSGEKAFFIINELFPSKNLLQQSSHTIHVGFMKDAENILDEVVISLFKSPRSYTGEDVVEISAHGSPFVQQKIIDACIKYGARLAKPGEFTQRAFLNGKMDLSQAEAVADLVADERRIDAVVTRDRGRHRRHHRHRHRGESVAGEEGEDEEREGHRGIVTDDS